MGAKTAPSEKPLVRVGETALLLGIHPDSVRQLERLGVLKPVWLHQKAHMRFRVADVLRLAEAGHWLAEDEGDGVDGHFAPFRQGDDE